MFAWWGCGKSTERARARAARSSAGAPPARPRATPPARPPPPPRPPAAAAAPEAYQRCWGAAFAGRRLCGYRGRPLSLLAESGGFDRGFDPRRGRFVFVPQGLPCRAALPPKGTFTHASSVQPSTPRSNARGSPRLEGRAERRRDPVGGLLQLQDLALLQPPPHRARDLGDLCVWRGRGGEGRGSFLGWGGVWGWRGIDVVSRGLGVWGRGSAGAPLQTRGRRPRAWRSAPAWPTWRPGWAARPCTRCS
jgi:hypothetical protein